MLNVKFQYGDIYADSTYTARYSNNIIPILNQFEENDEDDIPSCMIATSDVRDIKGYFGDVKEVKIICINYEKYKHDDVLGYPYEQSDNIVRIFLDGKLQYDYSIATKYGYLTKERFYKEAKILMYNYFEKYI